MKTVGSLWVWVGIVDAEIPEYKEKRDPKSSYGTRVVKIVTTVSSEEQKNSC